MFHNKRTFPITIATLRARTFSYRSAPFFITLEGFRSAAILFSSLNCPEVTVYLLKTLIASQNCSMSGMKYLISRFSSLTVECFEHRRSFARAREAISEPSRLLRAEQQKQKPQGVQLPNNRQTRAMHRYIIPPLAAHARKTKGRGCPAIFHSRSRYYAAHATRATPRGIRNVQNPLLPYR